MENSNNRLFLSWFKDGTSHITLDFEKATEYERKDLKSIKTRFGDRVILHKKRKGSNKWKQEH